MARQFQLRTGTTSELSNFKGAVGELTYNETTKKIAVHDGVVNAGIVLAREDQTNTAINNIIAQYLPLAYPASTPPSGYLVLMGQYIGTSYPILNSIYGQYLPDMRGLFIRGLDYGRGVDSGRGVLTWQQDELKSHSHNTSIPTANGGGNLDTPAVRTLGLNLIDRNWTSTTTGGVETRPVNLSWLYIVKAG